MVRIAVLSEQVSAQIRVAAVDRPREPENVEVVWSGTSGDELRRLGQVLRPQVLVLVPADQPRPAPHRGGAALALPLRTHRAVSEIGYSIVRP